MKETILKKASVHIMGVFAALCMAGGYNPIGFAYFASVFMEKGQRLFIFPVVMAVIAFTMPMLPAVKYMMAMVVYAVLFGLAEAGKGQVKRSHGGLLAGISVFAVQAAGAFMTREPTYGLWIGLFEATLVFALSLLLNVGVRGLLYKKSYESYTNDETAALGILFGIILYALRGRELFTVSVAPLFMYLGILFLSYRYGIGMGAMAGAACGMVMTLWHGDITMLGFMCFIGIMAGIFRTLGRLGSAVGFLSGIWVLGNFYAPFLLERKNLAGVLCGTLLFLLLPRGLAYRADKGGREPATDNILDEKRDRILEIAQSFKSLSKSIGRFHTRDDLSFAAAVQLSETANILEDMTEHLGKVRRETGRREDAIKRALSKARLDVRSVHIIEQQNGREKIQIEIKSPGGKIVTVREAAGYVGKGYGKRVRAGSDCKTIINGEYKSFTFVEEPNFMVLHGASTVTKMGEEISGDNFSCMELAEGQLLMGIVDGMGSGPEAYEDSEQVIGLLEDLLKAGYEEETALKLVNSVLLGKEKGESSTAVDIALTDLYSGKCSFFKSGAAATFIKRNQWVEVMKSTSLPVGVFQDVDYESAYKKLYDGDYIIMVSDGVLEAFSGEDKEERLGRLLMDIQAKKPKDIADAVIKAVREFREEEIADDMTVLVTGIWRKSA